MLPSHRSGSGTMKYRSLHVTLCKLASVGERQHQNVPKSNPLGSDGLWNAIAPDGEHLLTPDSLQSHNPDSRWRRVGQEPAGFPPCSGVRAEGAAATTRLRSTVESSVCPVLPLLVFLILLFVGTLGAEPLYLFWGCSRNPDARPVIPIVAVITTYHWTAIIWLVTARTDPDLVTPLVSDHISTDGLGHHAPNRSFGASCRRDGWRGRWDQDWWDGGLWRRRSWSWRRCDMNRSWYWWWNGWRSFGPVHGSSRFGLWSWHHLADDYLVLACTHS